MKMELIDEDKNEYLFTLTDKEVIEIVYNRLRKNNPYLSKDKIKRIGKEYVCEFKNSEDYNVRIVIDILQLKRFLGSRVVGFNKSGNGIHSRRIISRHRMYH